MFSGTVVAVETLSRKQQELFEARRAQVILTLGPFLKFFDVRGVEPGFLPPKRIV